MLSSLSIQNVVLIDRLGLEAAPGLCALTGETGAGKSILLDALGLALGGRADAKMVRHGAEQATVAAAFDVPPAHPVHALLREKGIDTQEGLVLRRTLTRDGRGKAFINDAPVSVQLLKDTGAALVEIHGQFETQGLLDPATHRGILDSCAGIAGEVSDLAKIWDQWRAQQEKLERARLDVEALRLQEDYLRHAVAELEKLDPKKGEDEILAAKRARLLNIEKASTALDQASQVLDSEDGVVALLGRAQNLLEKAGVEDAELSGALSRALAEASDVSWRIGKMQSGGADENLEDIEERYFALKECAKKHRVAPDDLPQVWQDLSEKLRLVTHQDDTLDDMKKAVAASREKYVALAEKISARRAKAAQKLAKDIQKELPDLKLDRAVFSVDCGRLEEGQWGPSGIDRVQFVVATNPGAPAGPLHKIASGGELARFTLAIKAVLAGSSPVSTLIFDEVDSGIGGAVADAVGERLARLAQTHQVLVVTHSPQVAARARHHWHVAKTEQKGAVITRITPLATLKDRAEEIARMLSGATVTLEARAQAAKLLEKADAA